MSQGFIAFHMLDRSRYQQFTHVNCLTFFVSTPLGNTSVDAV